MSETIWIHYARPRPHWYDLSDERQTALKAEWSASAERSKSVGAARVGAYHIRGNHDFETVEIWSFPNAEAAYEHWVRLTIAGYNEWFAYANNIGFGPIE
ncbi:hypothetical protein OSH11_04840 [Kaistia dalseonensis]|uniref:Uncharacterized protein n=1 Tax=Kaistia dalseonensis TaxID=410840 RepID=A0ABU0H2S8_9HYPH|nr:hypothetical protein [Kaistia dalseonensis]MCX5494015.1 hypothetical protein [Kaistia dalseonensis]MDQ0436592.1 hypothetical protein [Kaistia dalseonensis]